MDIKSDHKDTYLFENTDWNSFRATSCEIVCPHKRLGRVIWNWKKRKGKKKEKQRKKRGEMVSQKVCRLTHF